jgi:hypothetical protein
MLRSEAGKGHIYPVPDLAIDESCIFTRTALASPDSTPNDILVEACSSTSWVVLTVTCQCSPLGNVGGY